MRILSATIVAIVLGAAADAHALVESKCITPRGLLRGAVEFLPDALAERRRPCQGFQTEYRTPVLEVAPTPRAIALGLVPQRVSISRSFRLAMGPDTGPTPVAETANLEVFAGCGENPAMGSGGEAMVSWQFNSYFPHSPEVASAGDANTFFWWDDINGGPNQGDVIGTGWLLLSDDYSEDDRLAVLPVPDTMIANDNGESIAIRGATVTLNSPEAPCTVSGTVELVE